MCIKALRGTALGALSILLSCTLQCATAAEHGTLRPWPAKLGTPGLVLADASGKQWDLKQFHGKVVVLNFWASWCSPCVEELPILNKVTHEAGDKLVVLGVNYKEASWSVERFTQEHSFGFPVLLDKNGEHFKRWTSGVMPTTVLIDREGKARWRVTGAIDPGNGSFQQALEKLLAQ
jgi:thiol-disulfide isomerase/thioredoxin